MPIKRLNYFDHQFLHVDDFTDEQSYHRDMRRLHSQLLHTWGVATGLQLSYAAGATVASVSAGSALDGKGQEIVLTENANTPDVSNIPGAAGHPVFVTISYAEQQSDPSNETGTTGNRRVSEVPVLEVLTQPPSDPSLHIILGRVTVGSDGRLTGAPDDGAAPALRRSAGAVGGNLEVTSLTLRSPSVDPSTWPSLRVGAPNQANLTGSLSISGNLGVVGGVSAGGTVAALGVTAGPGGLGVAGATTLSGALVGATDMSLLTNTLSVASNTGIRQNSLYLSGGPSWSSLAFNAYHSAANDRWIFPDPSRTAVTAELDGTTGPGRFQVWLTTLANKTTFQQRLAVDGETGNVLLGLGSNMGNLGIGTAGPGARLDIVANSTTFGGWYEAIRFSQPAHSAITHPAGGLLFGLHGNRNFYFSDIAGGGFQKHLMIVSAGPGFVGIGTQNPANAPLQILGGNWDLNNSEGDLKVGDDGFRLKIGVARGGGGAGDARINAMGGTNRLFLGARGADMLTITPAGVGIGTAGPTCSLDIVAANTSFGGWYEAIRFSRPDHSAIMHPGGGLLFGLHGNRNFYFGDIQGGVFRRYVMQIGADNGIVSIPAGRLEVTGSTAQQVGTVNVGVNIALPSAGILHANGRLHFSCDENMYLLPRNGVWVSRAWGGTGDMIVEGNLGVGQPSSPHHPGWHGIHTWDMEAEGTVWSGHPYLSGAQDVAENFVSLDSLAAGEVVCFDADSDLVVRSRRPDDGMIFGVVSTAPGFILGADRNTDASNLYPVALCGRVPCKVVDENGPIKRGDLLTSSSTEGHAMKAMPVGRQTIYQTGTILGKALEPHASGTGVIEILVTAG